MEEVVVDVETVVVVVVVDRKGVNVCDFGTGIILKVM